jgi:hypothetical protein
MTIFKKNQKWILYTFIALCLLATPFILMKYFLTYADEAALFKQLRLELSQYYKVNGCYPKTLFDLNITEYPENASRSTLKTYNYKSDCTTFVCESNKGIDRIFIMKGKSGEITQKGFSDREIARKWGDDQGDLTDHYGHSIFLKSSKKPPLI